MKRRKELPSRKRRALRRCGLLLLALLLAEITGVYELIPARSIRRLADQVGVENPRVVEWFYDPAIPNSRSGLHMLVDGDRAMMLCYTGFSLSGGWDGGVWSTVPTWDGSGLYGGIYIHSQGDTQLGYVFGKLTEPGICRMTLQCTGRDANGQYQELGEMDIPESAVFSLKDGTAQYFLAPLTEELMEAGRWPNQYLLTGEMEDGATVTAEISERLWSA